MSLNKDNYILSSDIKDFKTRVKNEMARRKYNDSLAALATNFTDSAEKDEYAKTSHFTQTVGYINLIKATNISSDKIYSVASASTSLNTYASHPINWSSTDCTNSSCRGLCYGACGGGCGTACQGACSDECHTNCVSCEIGCSSSCGVSCAPSCSDICTSAHGHCSNERPSTL